MNSMVSKLNSVLASFKIAATCIDAREHRHFAFYDVRLDPGCRLNKLNNFSREIALSLRTKGSPIITAIPEKGIVRLQVTQRDADILHFNDLYFNRPEGILPFCFGETDQGEKMWVDINKNPHMLVAGTTGSGKSVFLHNLVANAARLNGVKVFLIDTKKVEFNIYDDPRIRNFIPIVANDYTSAISVLEFLHSLMESRYDHLASIGLSSIEQNPGIFDKVVLIVDEVADIMLMDKGRVFEDLITRLAAKCRACGIYLVLATQRPSVDIITGVIKANFSGRLACKVSSRVDSQVILDQHGAESLAGRGDAVFKNAFCDLTRLQIAYVNPRDTVARMAM